MLTTWDLGASIAFYTEVLGFTCDSFSDTDGWASLRRDAVALMLARPNRHVREAAPKLTGSLYFKIDDVDGLWNLIRNKVRVCYPIENLEYGMREFGAFDNQGYLLQFGQPLSTIPSPIEALHNGREKS